VGYYQGKGGCASLQQQRIFAQSCGRRLLHNYSKNALTYVTENMEAHPFVCPASRCTYGFTGHVTKAYVSDSNQIMVTYCSVYGDFSPTLYVVTYLTARIMDNFNTERFYIKCYRSNAYFMTHRRKSKQETCVYMNYSISPSGEHSSRLLKETYAVPICSSTSYGMDIRNMHQWRSPSN